VVRHLSAVLLAAAMLIAGCTGQAVEETAAGGQAEKLEQLEAAHKQLIEERDKWKQKAEELSRQVQKLSEEKEIRNLVDLQARQVIAAMLAKDQAALKQLVAKDVTVSEDQLTFSDSESGKQTTYPFPEQAKDVRQRWYELQPDGRFVTGMEVYGDDALVAVLVMTFHKEGDTWRLESVANDI